MRHLKTYADRINTEYAAEICGNQLSYIFYGMSLAGVSCRRRWPAPITILAIDNAIGLVGRQLEAVRRKFLITTNVYYCKKLNSLKHLVRTNVAESHN